MNINYYSAKKSRDKKRYTEPWRHLIKAAKMRAKKKMVAYDLDMEWAKSVWTGKCAITGIEFKIKLGEYANIYSASLDRIKPELGYIKSNCRFILNAINSMKARGTDKDIVFIANAIVQTHVT